MTEAVAAYGGNGLTIGRRITRCGICAFFEESGEFSPSGDAVNTVAVGECAYFGAHVTADGFCAWGRRSDVQLP